MPNFKDLSGQTFGRLTVIGRAGTTKHRKSTWICKCDCGNTTKPITTDSLRRGHTKSCGCLNKGKNSHKNRVHGREPAKLYSIWLGMRRRCTSKTDKSFKNYGGRGISVCDDWKKSFESFRDWSVANGYSDELSIDRIDANGDYCPENCRWVSFEAQQNNKRSNHYETCWGETHTIAEWSRLTGINYDCLKRRLQLGWSIEKALTTPTK